jgi:tetratricopeptide (TPR) repeat protein
MLVAMEGNTARAVRATPGRLDDLPALEICGNFEVVSGRPKLRPTPEVTALRNQAHDAQGKWLAGRDLDAIAQARRVINDTAAAQVPSPIATHSMDAGLGTTPGPNPEAALNAAKLEARADALFQLGRAILLRGNKGDWERAEEYLHQARRLAVSVGYDRQIADAWLELARSAYLYHSSTQRGRERLADAESVIARLGDPPSMRRHALRIYGLFEYRDGNYAEAARAQTDALALTSPDERADALIRAMLLQDLGNTLRDAWELARAGERYDEARALFEQQLVADHAPIGRRMPSEHPLLSELRFNEALLAMHDGRLETAESWMREVLQTRRAALGDDHWVVGNVRLDLAEILRQRGLLAEAEEQALLGQAIYERVFGHGHRKLEQGYTRLGAIQYRRGDHAGALRAYDQALQVLHAHSDPKTIDIGYIQANRAEAMVELGEGVSALNAIAEALSTPLGTNLADSPPEAGFVYGVRGRAQLVAGNTRAAIADLNEAAQQFEAMERDLPPTDQALMSMERADVYWAYARVLGRNQQGVRYADKARALYEAQPDEVSTPLGDVEAWLKQAQ